MIADWQPVAKENRVDDSNESKIYKNREIFLKLKIFSNKDDFESKRGITKDSSMCGAIFLV
ncbi:hypothetical protein [Nostoc sp.]|uniref:hypothetical protein n=1 Tax=Nostoc sp. TaxID=1180 RepID=UPI002FFBEF2E